MSHKDLINSLVKDLEPVKKKQSYYVNALQYLLFAYTFMFSVSVFLGFRRDFSMLISDIEVLAQVLALFLAGFLAVVVTFRLTIPSENVGKLNWLMVGGSVALLTGVILYCASGATISDARTYLNWDMVSLRLWRFALVSLLPIALMIWMIRKGRPVHTSLIGFTSFMAVTCISVTACRMICTVDSLFANLLWHYLPIVTLSLIGYLIGRFIYRW